MSQDDKTSKTDGLLDPATVAEALGARRRIVVIEDSRSHFMDDQPRAESQYDRLARLIIVEAAKERVEAIRISELQASLDHLTGRDQVFGTFDVLALPLLPLIDMVDDVVVQDDRSVQIVTALSDKPHAGKPQHQVWRIEPWNVDFIGSDPCLLLERPCQTMRWIRLEDKDRSRVLEMPRTFCIPNGETIRVEWGDPSRPGLNVLISETTKDVTELPNHWCQIFDVCATDKYLGMVFNLNVSGHASSDGTMNGQVTVRVRGTGANPLHEDHDRFTRAGWGMGSEMKCDDAKRVIMVDMIRRDSNRRITDRGLVIFTNTGYAFHPFVPMLTFKHAHVAMNAVWSWRYTARGIVLSRFPLP